MSLPPNQILEQKVAKVTLSKPPKTPFNFELSVCVHRYFANPQMFGEYLGYKGVRVLNSEFCPNTSWL